MAARAGSCCWTRHNHAAPINQTPGVETERYLNPRDPGMPAIRITGDDMKPQAFDVYSPKILAAIMSLAGSRA